MSEFFPGWLSFNSGSSEAADALVARADDDEDEDEDEDEIENVRSGKRVAERVA